MDYQIGEIVINQKHTNYIKAGNGKKPFVIIPGISMKSIILFAPSIVRMYERFLDEYTLYVFDRVDNIQTYKDYKIEDMAKDVLDCLNYLNLKDIYLYGASQGGQISLTIACINQSIIKKLAIASTSYINDEHCLNLFNYWKTCAYNSNFEALITSFLENVYTSDFNNKHKESMLRFYENLSKREIDSFSMQCAAATNFDLSSKLKDINVNTMIFHDTNDKIFDYNYAIKLKEKINGKLELTNTFAHSLYDEDPTFTCKIFNFFNN